MDPDKYLLDLRELSRHSDIFVTHVFYEEGHKQIPWIILGMADLRMETSDRNKGKGCLKAYLNECTDPEHDSAYLLSIDLIAPTLVDVYYGVTEIQAWVAFDDPKEFRVPSKDYDVMKQAVKCRECKRKDSHLIVPWDYYLPPVNEEEFKKFRGKKLKILFSAVDEKKE